LSLFFVILCLTGQSAIFPVHRLNWTMLFSWYLTVYEVVQSSLVPRNTGGLRRIRFSLIHSQPLSWLVGWFRLCPLGDKPHMPPQCVSVAVSYWLLDLPNLSISLSLLRYELTLEIETLWPLVWRRPVEWASSVFWGPKGGLLASRRSLVYISRSPRPPCSTSAADMQTAQLASGPSSIKGTFLLADRSCSSPRLLRSDVISFMLRCVVSSLWGFEEKPWRSTLPGTKDRLVRNAAMGLVRTSNVHVRTCQTVYLMRRLLVSQPVSRGPRNLTTSCIAGHFYASKSNWLVVRSVPSTSFSLGNYCGQL